MSPRLNINLTVLVQHFAPDLSQSNRHFAKDALKSFMEKNTKWKPNKQSERKNWQLTNWHSPLPTKTTTWRPYSKT